MEYREEVGTASMAVVVGMLRAIAPIEEADEEEKNTAAVNRDVVL